MKKILRNTLGALLFLGATIPSKAQYGERMLNTFYQPHGQTTEWNNFSESEKINKTETEFIGDTIPSYGASQSWLCGQFAGQTNINYHGFENVNQFNFDGVSHTSVENSKNLPVYSVILKNRNGEDHEINAIIVGDDLTAFDSWYFFEPQFSSNRRVYPGDWSMNENTSVSIEFTPHHNGESIGNRIKIVEWQLTNKVPELAEYDGYAVVMNPRLDNSNPNLNSSTFNKTYFPNLSEFEASASDESFLNHYLNFKLNGVEDSTILSTISATDYLLPAYNSNLTVPISPVEGNNTLEVTAKDIAGNKTTNIYNFVIDSQDPEITATASDSTLEYLVSDANLDLSKSYYQIDGGTKNYFSKESDTLSLDLEEGDHNINIYAEDKAGNKSTESIYHYVEPTSTNEIYSNNNLNVYPNPTSGNLTIDGIEPESNVEVYNASGKLVNTFESYGEGSMEITLPEKPGMYIIKNEDEVKKVINQ